MAEKGQWPDLGCASLPGSWAWNTNGRGGVTLFLLITEQPHFISFWMEYCSSVIKYVRSIKYGLALGFAGARCTADFPIWPKLFVLVLWPGKQMDAFQRLWLRWFKLFHCNMEQILTCQPWGKKKKKQSRYTAEMNKPLIQTRACSFITHLPFIYSMLSALLAFSLFIFIYLLCWVLAVVCGI